MAPTILLADDDELLAEVARLALEEAGYDVTVARDGLEALKLVQQGQPDLVILDVMLPQMDGWEACLHMRETSDVPILMLTAKDEEGNKLRGLQGGADIYMTKPFDLAVLVAQVGALLRRSRLAAGLPKHVEVAVGDLRVDLPRQQVTRAGQPIELTPTEFRLLATLASRAGEVVPHQELLTQVWGPEYLEEEAYLKLYVWYLRQKVEEDPSHPRYILTKRGRGYYLTANGSPDRAARRPEYVQPEV